MQELPPTRHVSETRIGINTKCGWSPARSEPGRDAERAARQGNVARRADIGYSRSCVTRRRKRQNDSKTSPGLRDAAVPISSERTNAKNERNVATAVELSLEALAAAIRETRLKRKRPCNTSRRPPANVDVARISIFRYRTDIDCRSILMAHITKQWPPPTACGPRMVAVHHRRMDPGKEARREWKSWS